MLNNLRLYIRQEHGLWRFVAPVVQNVKITQSNAATSITTTRLNLTTLITPNRLVTGRGLMTRSFGDHRRRTIANPTFTRRSRKTSKKFPATSRNLLSDPSHFITAAMLPSRGIVRSLPSGAFQRPCGHSVCLSLTNSSTALTIVDVKDPG